MAVRFCHHFFGGVIYKEESVKQENGRRGEEILWEICQQMQRLLSGNRG